MGWQVLLSESRLLKFFDSSNPISSCNALCRTDVCYDMVRLQVSAWQDINHNPAKNLSLISQLYFLSLLTCASLTYTFHSWLSSSKSPNLRLRKMVMFATWSSSRTEFLVQKVFCNDNYSSSFSGTWRRFKREVNLSRVCSNTSTFVPDDLAQCLSCVLFATWCALVLA